MRILFLAHRLPYPPNKGDKIRSFWELTTLSKRHQVDLFCFYDDPQDKVHVEGVRNYCHSCYAEPLSFVASRTRALGALLRGRAFSSEFFHSTSMAKRIKQAVESEAYDVAFIFGSSMAHFVEPWPQIPTLLDLVDVDSDKWTQYSRQSAKVLSWLWRLEGQRLEKCESEFVRTLTNTLVCTDAEERVLRRKAPVGKISVLQNSLDTNYFQPDRVAIPEEIRKLQPYVIFTGTMDYFPNVDAVQYFTKDVFPIVRSQIPNARFVIAGRSPGTQVRRLAEDPAIHVTGTVPDIRPYLQGAAMAVAPMRIARGVQNKILEALAMDVPVVASAAAANALPSELSALLTTESEPRSIADRVVTYLSNPPKRTGFLCSSVKSYIDGLDLPSQLEQLLREAVVTGSNRVLDERVEVAV